MFSIITKPPFQQHLKWDRSHPLGDGKLFLACIMNEGSGETIRDLVHGREGRWDAQAGVGVSWDNGNELGDKLPGPYLLGEGANDDGIRLFGIPGLDDGGIDPTDRATYAVGHLSAQTVAEDTTIFMKKLGTGGANTFHMGCDFDASARARFGNENLISNTNTYCAMVATLGNPHLYIGNYSTTHELDGVGGSPPFKNHHGWDYGAGAELAFSSGSRSGVATCEWDIGDYYIFADCNGSNRDNLTGEFNGPISLVFIYLGWLTQEQILYIAGNPFGFVRPQFDPGRDYFWFPKGARGAGAPIDVDAVLTAGASLTAAVDILRKGEAALTAGASLTADIDIQRKGEAILTAGASLTAAVDILRKGETSLTAGASLTAAVDVIRKGEVILTAGASLTAAVEILRKGEATLTAGATLVAAVDILRPGAAVLTAGATLVATAELSAIDVDATLTAGATLTAAANLLINAASVLTAGASLTAAVDVQRKGAAVLTSGSSLTAAADIQRTGAAVLTSGSSLAAVVDIQREASATLTSGASVTAAIDVLRAGAAILTAGCTLVGPVAIIREGAVVLTAGATLTATAEILGVTIPPETIETDSQLSTTVTTGSVLTRRVATVSER